MTIDSSWIACFKEEVPEAFRAAQPFSAKAVFCDGQIRPMRCNDWDFMTWAQYVWHQFHSHLKRFYEDGADRTRSSWRSTTTRTSRRRSA